MMRLTTQEIAELTSLGLTFPTFALACWVVWSWGPAAWAAIKATEKTGEQWFIVGVTVGFIGAAMDNLFWFFPWTASYLESPTLEQMFGVGVYFNIVFRQGLGIAAAYCHVRAAEAVAPVKRRRVNKLFLWAHLAGLVYVVGLYGVAQG